MTNATAELLPAPDHAAQPRPGASRWRQLGVDSVYVLSSFPLALASFVLVVTGLSVGAATLVLWAGLPLLTATLLVASRLAAVERARIPGVLRESVPAPAHRRAARGASPARRLLVPLQDPQRWRDALHGVLHLAVSTVTFTVVLTWWAGALGGITYPAWSWAVPDAAGNEDLPELLGLGDGLAVRVVLYLVAGLVLLLTLPPVTRAMALLGARLGRVLLSPRADPVPSVDGHGAASPRRSQDSGLARRTRVRPSSTWSRRCST